MTPEERKAIAMPQSDTVAYVPACDRFYPKCCQYHEGYDAALRLLIEAGWAAKTPVRQTELEEYGYFSANGEPDRDHPVPLYAFSVYEA